MMRQAVLAVRPESWPSLLLAEVLVCGLLALGASAFTFLASHSDLAVAARSAAALWVALAVPALALSLFLPLAQRHAPQQLARLSAAKVSPDGQKVLAVGFTQGPLSLTTAFVWDGAQGTRVPVPVHAFAFIPSVIDTYAFSPDGQWLLVGSDGVAPVRLVNLQTGQVRRFRSLGQGWRACALGPQGEELVLTSAFPQQPGRLVVVGRATARVVASLQEAKENFWCQAEWDQLRVLALLPAASGQGGSGGHQLTLASRPWGGQEFTLAARWPADEVPASPQKGRWFLTPYESDFLLEARSPTLGNEKEVRRTLALLSTADGSVRWRRVLDRSTRVLRVGEEVLLATPGPDQVCLTLLNREGAVLTEEVVPLPELPAARSWGPIFAHRLAPDRILVSALGAGREHALILWQPQQRRSQLFRASVAKPMRRLALLNGRVVVTEPEPTSPFGPLWLTGDEEGGLGVLEVASGRFRPLLP